MREFLSRGLDSIFGKGGCMEQISSFILKFLLFGGIAYLGIRMLTENINNSPNIQVLATATLQPTATEINPTSTPIPQETCVTIDGYLVPNAFRAWLRLGKPGEVIFKDIGISGNNEVQKITDTEDDGIVNNLPDLVHNGDQLCTQLTSP
jgi:hypothetical protein